MKNVKFFQVITFLSVFSFTVLCNAFVIAQVIPEHISNQGIYFFLDELASQKIIEINSLIKPYSRELISQKLIEAEEKKEQLNKRQQVELDHYLRDYNLELNRSSESYKYNVLSKTEGVDLSFFPFGLFYHDSLFRISIKPIYGIKTYANHDSVSFQRWGGGILNGYIGKNFGFYMSLSDHQHKYNTIRPNFLTKEQGAILKGEDYRDFSEIRGGFTWSWNWGSLGLIKDHLAWGEGYNGSNIFSGRTPSTTMINFEINPAKWFGFKYIHARLASDILDSNKTYRYSSGGVRKVMREKYIVANMFTFKPFKNFHISAGNSLVYSDEGIQIQYLNPFMFYKSVDDTYNSTDNQAGHNAQMFASISSRNIKYLHLYTTAFVDEISIRRMRDPQRHSNFVSLKAGLRASNVFKSNINFTAEYTRTNPLTYQHFIPTTSFETNKYCMGHYLKDNAEEMFFALEYKPFSRLLIGINYTDIKKGTPYKYGVVDPWGVPFMDNIDWSSKRFSGVFYYELMSKFVFHGEGTIYFNEGNAHKYNPFYFSREKGIAITAGMHIGF